MEELTVSPFEALEVGKEYITEGGLIVYCDEVSDLDFGFPVAHLHSENGRLIYCFEDDGRSLARLHFWNIVSLITSSTSRNYDNWVQETPEDAYQREYEGFINKRIIIHDFEPLEGE